MNKQEIINKYGTTDKDTGSPSVQISILTHDISKLQGHLESFKKDFHSRMGLMGKISKRRKLMQLLKQNAPVKYQDLIKELGIRG
ncbi:MAG: 30S ribosomal protein S15 [Candidatus Portiera sp.]|nr:30S ribosomal protein S15 [Portiera sp.]